MPIPGYIRPAWYAREFTLEVVQLLAVVGAAGLGTLTVLSNASADVWMKVLSSSLLVIAVLLSLIKVARARVKDASDEGNRHPRDLEGCLHVVYQLLRQRDASAKVRATIHRVVTDPKLPVESQYLEQVTPYVGEPFGKVQRKFPVSRGVMGLAVRKKAPMRFKRETTGFDEYVENLVERWGFTEAEAKTMHKDRMSGIAIPLQLKGEVIGVVYCDSDGAETFDAETIANLVRACDGIVDFIGVRYP